MELIANAILIFPKFAMARTSVYSWIRLAMATGASFINPCLCVVDAQFGQIVLVQ